MKNILALLCLLPSLVWGMSATDIPSNKFPIPWGNSAGGGYINSIPVASQILVTPGRASLTDGFVPLNFTPISAGGVPPFGGDMNGIINQMTAWLRWSNAGGPITYDSGFSASVGGYPLGAFLYSASGNAWWLNNSDSNTSNPDTGGSGWFPINFGNAYTNNPNGSVACHSPPASPGYMVQAMVWDTGEKLLWVCTTAGSASTAVWTQVSSVSNSYWAGPSSGSANVQTTSGITGVAALSEGMTVQFLAGYTNTGNTTLKIGTLSAVAFRQQSPSGLVALSGGEIVAGSVISATYDGTYFQINQISPVQSINGLTGTPSVTGSTGISVSASGSSIAVTNTGVTSNVGGSGINVSGSTGAVTITNAGVVSNIAGTGISVGGPTGNVTITNTGVTSLNGLTGTPSVTGSTGVSVSASGSSIAVTNTGVTGLTAGTAIGVSGSTGNVTVSNNGVTSLAGSGNVSVSGSTGAVTVSSTAMAAHYLTGSRSFGTVYTNSTGLPMLLVVSYSGNSTVVGHQNGVSLVTIASSTTWTLTMEIPSGSTYDVTITSGTPSLLQWWENY